MFLLELMDIKMSIRLLKVYPVNHSASQWYLCDNDQVKQEHFKNILVQEVITGLCNHMP